MAAVDPRPIVIRWDRTDDSAAKLKFPIKDHTGTFENLVRDCQSTASVPQGQDVDDASVSKASAIDDSRFSTNLCPYKLGIMPRIEQLLLPNIADIGRGGVNDGGSVVAKIAKMIQLRSRCRVFDIADKIACFLIRADIPELETSQ
ncbi:hypothetical protein FJTKL_07424 [Diaporthe vaccinii]|uniref:Uncharacterized protein n=1 Tax=Diaporthe vaccinii TaxID=105482 RepID=A0ABR4EU11_9PEZI